jgi:uncharacterized protein YmfQ (DUF2313 family)
MATGRSYSDYTGQLEGLTPRGKAWTKNPNSILGLLRMALSYELARLDARAYDLLDENIPANSVELLAEYEEELGITIDSTATSDRQIAIATKIVARGGLFKEYYTEVALSLGYSITFFECSPFWVGLMSSISIIGDQKNIFVFFVYADTLFDAGGFDLGFDAGFTARASDTDIDPVCAMTRSLDSLILEIDKIKPAHSFALYDFYGRGFSRGFSWGYECLPYHDGIIPIAGLTTGFDTGFAAIAEYEGTYLVGGFDKGFLLGFDVCHGGGFTHDGFDSGFDVPR